MLRVALLLLAALASEGVIEPEDMQHELDLRGVPACYTLLNTKGPVGCRSPLSLGETTPISVLDSQQDLDSFTQEPQSNGARSAAVLLAAELLTRDNMIALQSSRCAGVLLADSTSPPAQGFSPADSLPYCKCGASPPCTEAWNPTGNGLELQSFDFPMISLTPAQTATLRRRMKQSNADVSAFPQYQVQMNYFMDVFQGYVLVKGQWWERQPESKCCSNCRPNCGRTCCRAGFTCTSTLSDDSLGWPEPTCARPHLPTSLSCLERGTCLPMGGYSVWSINSPLPLLSSPPSPAAATSSSRNEQPAALQRTVRAEPDVPQPRVVMATASMDSSALLHERAAGGGEASAVIALIATADALRAWRDDMRHKGGAILMFALFQAENWDFIGSRRVFDDMQHFRCKQRQPAEGTQVCIDPPMLAPDIDAINASMIEYVLQVQQLMPSDESTLYLHTGCNPSAHTRGMSALLLDQPPAPPPPPPPPPPQQQQQQQHHKDEQSMPLALTAADGDLPLPTSSFLSTIFGEEGSGRETRAARRPRGMGVIAGYNRHFNNKFYHSRFDRPSWQADVPRLCGAASRVAQSLYILATGLPAPAAIRADCQLVERLAKRLYPPPPDPAKGNGQDEGAGGGRREEDAGFATAYSSVYLPPLLRGPTSREQVLHEELALANALVPPPSCDCCLPHLHCTPLPNTRCFRGAAAGGGGKCVSSTTFFHDSYPLGMEFSLDKRAFVLTLNASSLAHPLPFEIWAEASWQANIGASGFLRDDPQTERVGVVLGIVVVVVTGLAWSGMLRYYHQHFKQS